MSTANNDVALTVPETQPQRTALADLRAHSMSVPVEVMQHALAEYSERRDYFRDWLRQQLIAGVHYGVPPGCEPKVNDRGEIVINGTAYPKEQWQTKPSLYKAGAAFICDLLGIRAEFKADTEAWHQLGSPNGTFVMACRLYSRQTGELIGEGRGVRRQDQKKQDANANLKMAEKCSLVDAVLNAYALSDLFTQDIDEPPERYDNPAQQPDAPQAGTRQQRAAPVTAKQVASLVEQWKANRHDSDATPDKWAEWVFLATGCNFEVKKASQWTQKMVEACECKLQRELGGTP